MNKEKGFMKRAYQADFGIKLSDHDKVWVTHMLCKTYPDYMRRLTKDKKSCLKYGIPMVWRESTNHVID